MAALGDFEALTPDLLLSAVETAMGVRLTGLTHQHPSYINRVYELQDTQGTRLIVKFYRPGRWNVAALQAEHDFVGACAAAEIPVIAPLPLASGKTLGRADGYCFAVYPKRWGRTLELNEPDAWRRLGRLLARVHLVGQREPAPARITLHPAHSTRSDVADLLAGGQLDPSHEAELRSVTGELLELITPGFADCEMIRIHGDCHAANVLDRPDEGLMLIDFDDMAMGPPIQDLWMLLPGSVQDTRGELRLVLEGYTELREFDHASLRLAEPLRAMRVLYFLAWCARQQSDPGFRHHFPDWGSFNFWAKELGELRVQLDATHRALEA